MMQNMLEDVLLEEGVIVILMLMEMLNHVYFVIIQELILKMYHW